MKKYLFVSACCDKLYCELQLRTRTTSELSVFKTTAKIATMNGSEDDLFDNGNWTWTSKSASAETRVNCTSCTAVHRNDPGVELLRHVVEVWLTTPIVLLGITGNVVAFFILCQHRRHKLQTTTAILQVTSHTVTHTYTHTTRHDWWSNWPLAALIRTVSPFCCRLLSMYHTLSNYRSHL